MEKEKNKIIKITKLKQCQIRNNHNGFIGIRSDILVIEFSDGTKNYLDVQANCDITDCNYLEIITSPFTRTQLLFKDELTFSDE